MHPTLSLLTEEEKELLCLHLGCFKCHMFYAGHVSWNCTNPHPTPANCKNITAALAAKAKLTYEKKNGSTIVATVFEGVTMLENSNNEVDTEEFMDINADEYISYPFSLPFHLRWTCCIDAPVTCAPTPINALIDHGCPPVLISEQLADILCLTPQPLFKLRSVTGAFTKENKNPGTPLL